MRIVGLSGYRCRNPRAICSGDQRCASRLKTAVCKRDKRDMDGECPGLPRVVGSALGPLVGGHRPIGHGRGYVTSKPTRQGIRGSAQSLGSGSEAMSRSR
jgi:hypothetical protein